MRIHSDTLTVTDLNGIMKRAAVMVPDVDLIMQGAFGSRSRKYAHEVALRGKGVRHTKRPNTGITGSRSDEYAATYDDWGWFLACLYELDENAIAGPYKGVGDFHAKTKYAYS